MTRCLTYDTGALIAAERNDGFVWALHEAALAEGIRITVPAGVLAQAWRGGPQARLSSMLKGCEIEPLGETRARAAGSLCATAATADTTDAAVVLGAGLRGDAIVTSDADDIRHLCDAVQLPMQIVEV